ncbi:sugar phosphate isomerase/epimerase family protein [Tundrisphaera lichenicola]|uniref:sugar phosphate isomerase/epimerase family protein n=1 Tax=Tundrisphaera lichenicola TaxID=2029860 RepID=UPI003EBAB098
MIPDASQPLSRRDLLASSLAAVGTLSLLGRRIEAAPIGPYGPFKMGLQSYSLRHYKVEEALAKTKELGLHYWESYNAHTPIDPSKVAESKGLADSEGVEIIGFGVSGFSKDHEKNRTIFEFGKALGVAYLSADPSLDSFDSLDKLTEEYGIAIGIHPHGPGAKWQTIDQISDAIKNHSEKIGICLDTGHLLRSHQDPVRAVDVFAERIYGVHLKDVKDAKTFTILGEGDLKLAELLKKLARINYSYCLALEYEESETNPIPDIRKCLEATSKAIAAI